MAVARDARDRHARLEAEIVSACEQLSARIKEIQQQAQAGETDLRLKAVDEGIREAEKLLVTGVTREDLPAAQTRHLQEKLGAVRAELERTRSTSVPAARFAFRRPAAAVAPSSTASPPSMPVSASPPSAESAVAGYGQRVEDLSGVTRLLGAESEGESKSASGSGSVLLRALRDCRVGWVDGCTGAPNALRCEALERCRVVLLVDGPAYLQGCRDCVFVLAARQVRLQETHGCRLYLATPARPVLERCSDLRFAPLLPDALPPHARSRLERILAAAANAWDQVDDFDHLKQGPSPNWTVEPPADRLSCESLLHLLDAANGLS